MLTNLKKQNNVIVTIKPINDVIHIVIGVLFLFLMTFITAPTWFKFMCVVMTCIVFYKSIYNLVVSKRNPI